ncbi:regulator of chromosome condensation [Nematocida ausubeli]|nr:regulator of chromosome condensation [Nematocida ausubeli]
MENKKFITRVYSWGAGDAGQLGTETEEGMSTKPIEITYFSNKRIVEVVCGGMHSLALSIDGSVYSWGCNDEGVLGRCGNEEEPSKIVFPNNVKIKKVVAGDSISAAVDENDELWTWGLFRGPGGVIGHSINKDESVCKMAKAPLKMDGIKVAQVQAGCNHLAVIDTKGKLYTWGDGENGKLGRVISKRGKSTGCLLPRVSMASASSAVTGAYHSFAVKRMNSKGEKSSTLAKQCLYTEGKFFKDTAGNEMYMYDQMKGDLSPEQAEEARKRKMPTSAKYKYIRITPSTKMPMAVLYPPKGMTVYCTPSGELTLDPSRGKKIALPTTRLLVDGVAPVAESSAEKEVRPVTKGLRVLKEEEEKHEVTEDDIALYAEYLNVSPGDKPKKVIVVNSNGEEKEVLVSSKKDKNASNAKKPRSKMAEELIKKAKMASMKEKERQSGSSEEESSEEACSKQLAKDEEAKNAENAPNTHSDKGKEKKAEGSIDKCAETKSKEISKKKSAESKDASESTADPGPNKSGGMKDTLEPGESETKGGGKVATASGADSIKVDSTADANASEKSSRNKAKDEHPPGHKRKMKTPGRDEDGMSNKKRMEKRRRIKKASLHVKPDKSKESKKSEMCILLNEVQRMALFDRRRKDMSDREECKKIKLSASGVNNYGQAPNANENGTWGPWIDYSQTPEGGPETFRKGMGGEHSTHILDANGTLWAVGRNTFGQLGVGDNLNKTEFTKCAISNVDDFAITASHGIAISHGKAYSWGFGEEGQLGYEMDTQLSPKQVVFDNEIVISVGAGGQHSAIVTAVDVTEDKEISSNDVIFSISNYSAN